MDKSDPQIKAIDARLAAVEKAGYGKRIEALEKGFEQLKAIIAQLAKTVEAKKDQASIDEQMRKQAEKYVKDLQLQAKDLQLEARLMALEAQVKAAMAVAGAR
jgi:hypothetical protein